MVVSWERSQRGCAKSSLFQGSWCCRTSHNPVDDLVTIAGNQGYGTVVERNHVKRKPLKLGSLVQEWIFPLLSARCLHKNRAAAPVATPCSCTGAGTEEARAKRRSSLGPRESRGRNSLKPRGPRLCRYVPHHSSDLGL